jgi:hypothetical protein
MKNRWLPALVGGFVVGVAVGFGLGLWTHLAPGPRAAAAPPPDRVIEYVDFKAAVAWAGQGKWTAEPFPVEPLNATEFQPLSPASQGNASARGSRYLAKCDQPLSVDEQQTFFNRFMNHLSDTLGKHSQPGGGGAVGQIPVGRLRVYCWHSDFHTGEDPNLGTAGGVRGTATATMVSDGQSSALVLALTEVTPHGR